MIHFTMIQAWGAILACVAVGAVIGGGICFGIGYIWGSAKHSGDSTPCQDFYNRYNALEAENERLKYELKTGVSIE